MLILIECMLEHNGFYNHHHHHHRITSKALIKNFSLIELLKFCFMLMETLNGQSLVRAIAATAAGTGFTTSTAFDTSSATTASEL